MRIVQMPEQGGVMGAVRLPGSKPARRENFPKVVIVLDLRFDKNQCHKILL